jgi:hypothetical protein
MESKHTNMIRSRPIKQVSSSIGAAVFPKFKRAENPNAHDLMSF